MKQLQNRIFWRTTKTIKRRFFIIQIGGQKDFPSFTKEDGTYPKPPDNGSGVMFIGDTEPFADLDKKESKNLL